MVGAAAVRSRVVQVGVSGWAYGEQMAAVVPTRRVARGRRGREVGIAGAVASVEAVRARAGVRDGLGHVRRAALCASWRRAATTTSALALGGGTGAVGLGADVGWSIALAVAAGTVGLVRWWRHLPPGRAAPDATERAWQVIAEGERRSASSLRRLARQGWFVIHDPVLGDGRSLGQVVIGPPGIAVLQSCVCQGPLHVDATGVWLGASAVDLPRCVAAAQAVCDVVAHELGRPGVRVMPVLVVHGAPMVPDGCHVAGVDVVPAAQLVRYLQHLRLARLDAEMIGAAGRAIVARLDVGGVPTDLDGVGRYCRGSS